MVRKIIRRIFQMDILVKIDGKSVEEVEKCKKESLSTARKIINALHLCEQESEVIGDASDEDDLVDVVQTIIETGRSIDVDVHQVGKLVLNALAVCESESIDISPIIKMLKKHEISFKRIEKQLFYI